MLAETIANIRRSSRGCCGAFLGHGGAGDLKAFGDASLRPAVLDHQVDEFAAPFRSQGRVEVGNVRDEGLCCIE
jgi:hypothetical protein